MNVCYNKLWKLLIDKGYNKKNLREIANLSPNTVAQMGRNELVSMEVLLRICEVLHCDIGDVMEFIEEGTKDEL